MVIFFWRISMFLKTFVQSVLSLLKMVMLTKKSSLKFIEQKKPLIIMGNGPSMKTDIDKVKANRPQFDLLCVNNFPNTDFYTEVKPNYFIIVSSEFWNNDNTIDQNKQTRYDIIDALIERTKWPLKFFVPTKARSSKPFIEKVSSNTNIEILFYNITPIEGFDGFNNWAFQMNLGMPRPHNVLIPSIIASLNSGYKNIALLGADHSWLPEISVDENNNALISQKHFYESVMDKKANMYNKGKTPRKLHEILHKFMLSFKAYHIIEGYSKTKTSSVINCTETSYIDAFQRQSLSQFLDKTPL